MKSKIILLLVFIVFVYGNTILEKLSNDETIEALEIMDQIENANDTALVQLKDQFYRITGETYDTKYRKQLYDIIIKNTANVGMYSKLVGLLSFQNFLLICMVIIGVVFVVSFMFDIIVVFGEYVGFFLYKIFFTKKSLYIQGFLLSYITLYYKVDQITNTYIRYLFIFDRMTPLFGCIIFYLMLTFIFIDYFVPISQTGTSKDSMVKDIIVTIVWTVAAIYHNNKIIGIAVVIMIFRMYGFLFGSTFWGYCTGFDIRDRSLTRCAEVSIVLNAVMLFSKIGIITGNITTYIDIFDTGVYFWATLVGAIAMLILSDEYYQKYYLGINNNLHIYIITQLLMVVYCLTIIFLGNILYITPYQAIGGTFLVLWTLDVERTFLKKFRHGSTTILLFILLVNLYLIKQYISWYPEYFIL